MSLTVIKTKKNKYELYKLKLEVMANKSLYSLIKARKVGL